MVRSHLLLGWLGFHCSLMLVPPRQYLGTGVARTWYGVVGEDAGMGVARRGMMGDRAQRGMSAGVAWHGV